jgi:hypothetical protein
MNTHTTLIVKEPNVANHLSDLHEVYDVVLADKAPNTIVFVCKWHYTDCLIKELGIDHSLGNPTYTPTTITKEETLDNHRSVEC